MSEHDDLAPAEADTAITDSPTEAPAGEATEQEINWQKRAEDAQAWATRAAQEAAELRQMQEAIRTDPDAQRQFLAELGFDLEDDTPDAPSFDDDDPVSALEQRLAAIEAKAQQDEHDRQLQAAEAHFAQAFERLGVPEDEQDAVIGLALTMPPGKDGMPPVEEAAKRVEAMWETRQKNWAGSKKTSHPFSPNGEAGTQQPNLDDPQERQAWMAQRLADLNAG